MDEYSDSEVGEEEEGVPEMDEAEEEVVEEEDRMDEQEENHTSLQTSSFLQFLR